MPPKAIPDQEGLKVLEQDLNSGKPGKLYLFYGEETYLRDHYLGRLREQLLAGGMGTFNLHQLSARDMSPHALEEAVDCLPMMGERTLVQVTDYDPFKAGEKDREGYLRILSQLPDYCCLVFLYDLIEYKRDARTKLAAALKQHGTAVNFCRQEQGKLERWIQTRFRALGKEISAALARDLIFLCGDLMTTLISEIEKIAAYAQGKRITREDVEAVATPRLEAVVFGMTDAISRGDFDQAACVLGSLYQRQEKTIKLMGTLGWQLRQLYSARLTLESGRGKGYLVSLWGLREFQAEKLLSSARRLSLDWCRQGVIRCAQTDLAMKSTGISEQGRQELIVNLLLELAASRQEG
ncbi:MAG: DNA polymerase III subunit delta [Lawsonibacter sp.]|nr:DNA polymerase III subunit delta [Lawsonibacter sp.]